MLYLGLVITIQWRHNGRGGVSNHHPDNCSLNCLFIRRSKKTSKLLVTGLCAGNSPATGEFPAQRASNAKDVSIWWRHHNISSQGLTSNYIPQIRWDVTACPCPWYLLLKWHFHNQTTINRCIFLQMCSMHYANEYVHIFALRVINKI